ncbi:MAG: hypothetical protein MJB14_18220, partial [Spirochaetes bacterium]|nr:hypothetical protein [Spirochaetota bacterium]
DLVKEELVKLEDYRKSFAEKYQQSVVNNIRNFNLMKYYQNIEADIHHSDRISIIEGWVERKKVKALKTGLEEKMAGTFSLVVYTPEELDEVQNGTLTVPVVLDNLKFFKPFEEIVFNYGAPKYGSIDPTMYLAISFLTLFGLMFGDMGQGLVILLGGLILKAMVKPGILKKAGSILIAVGFTSMIFGYLYGAAFCFEHHELEGLLTPINQALWGIDRPFILDTTIDNILNLFILTVGYGWCINLLGMLINIGNHILNKKYWEAVFKHNGLLTFLVFFSVGIIAIQGIVLNIQISSFFFIIIAVALVLIFLHEPILAILHKEKHLFHQSIGLWFLSAIVEVFEVILQLFTNNLSFIRVGAFAFAHALLSSVVLILARILGGGLFTPAGILIIIIGNAFIIILEGMIVSIQTIRLNYYEFFSKFFTEQGKRFNPFKIEKIVS